MAYVGDVFDAAMGIMDELDAEGGAQTADTAEYMLRAPAIVNALISELKILTGEYDDWLPVESLDDLVPAGDTSYALGALPYGLAANLLVDENPSAASFYQQRYEELRAYYLARLRAHMGAIENLYGGIEYGEFGEG